MANDGTETTVGKRDKLEREYILPSGEATKKLSPDCIGVKLTVKATGEAVSVKLADLFEGETPAPGMWVCAALFGLNTVLGNQVAGETDTSKMAERIADRASAIVEDKEWSSGRDGGPRMGMVIDAWALDAQAKGFTVTDELRAACKSEIQSGVTSTKDLLSDDGVNAQYQSLLLQQQQAKVDAAKAKIGSAGTGEARGPYMPGQA